MAYRQELLSLLRERALGFGDILLASGKRSNYYIDGRLVTLSGRGALVVGHALWEELRGDNIDAVGGPTLGADPIATAVALVAAQQGTAIDAFIVRKEAKQHGRGRLIEGPPFRPGARVVIVDDTATTGASLLRAAQAAQEAGAIVVRVITLVDRDEGARQLLESEQLRFTPLFEPRDLGVVASP